MTDERKAWWGVTEVAERFGIDRSTVTIWIANGYFPGARKRGLAENSPWIIPAAAVEEVARKLSATEVDEEGKAVPTSEGIALRTGGYVAA